MGYKKKKEDRKKRASKSSKTASSSISAAAEERRESLSENSDCQPESPDNESQNNPTSAAVGSNIEPIVSPPVSGATQCMDICPAPSEADNQFPEEFTEKLQVRQTQSSPVCARPGYGKLGVEINLIANCFRIKVPDITVYHYDVTIRNDTHASENTGAIPKNKKYRCAGTKMNRLIINALIQQDNEFRGHHPAFDGRKNLYTRRRLKKSASEYKVLFQEQTFIVSLKEVNKDKDRNVSGKKTCAINLSAINSYFDGNVSDIAQEAMMAIETILRHTPCLTLTPIGRSFFSPPTAERTYSLGCGQEVWFGYHQSLRIGQWSPIVNLDISASIFYEEGPILDFAKKILGPDGIQKARLSEGEIKKLSEELKTLKIKTTHTRRLHNVVRVTKEPASKLKFEYKNNMVTISDYFWLRYNKKLQYPNLPCLQLNPETKKIYLPLEYGYLVAGQHCRKELSKDQKKILLRYTTVFPKERFAKIQGIANNSNFNSDETCREFNITAETEPVRVTGRMLNAPTICYKDRVPIRPVNGKWDMRDKLFYKSADVKNWVFLSFATARQCPLDSMNTFAVSLRQICQERGLSLPVPVDTIISNNNVASVLRNIKELYTPSFVLIIIDKAEKKLYNEVKRVAETDLHLITQCVKHDNVKSKKPDLIRNLSLKLNTKLGGINSRIGEAAIIPLFRKPIIIMGADVTHPSPTENELPSIASIVGSLDSVPSRYAITYRTQTHSSERKSIQEVIKEVNMESMVKELLLTFRQKTKQKPEKIIFFRDGVSEGQFEEVSKREVSSIRRACQGLYQDYQPGITYIVIQKRHHIRFRLTDKDKNVPPGTTVDTVVTHPINFDFLQISHNSPLGTARPAYYTVIEDDNKFTADDLQKLTNQLCYNFARCTQSISIPTPVMYAHLAAFRIRHWLLSENYDNSSDSGSDSSQAKSALSQGSNILNRMKAISDSMFFV